MPSQVISSVENNFTKGLITESTGMNFPENAATDCDNCEFTLIGDVTRRLGITYEFNSADFSALAPNSAMSSYIWNNAGGDGEVKLYVRQVGAFLFFYRIDLTTTTVALSENRLATSIDMHQYAVGTLDTTSECTFADGNGYLFVYNGSCNPFYVSYSGGVVTSNIIPLQIRDFGGVNDLLAPSTRPANLTSEHLYNLLNQGWISGQPWSATSSTTYVIGATGANGFIVASGIGGIVAGQTVTITYNGGYNPLLPPAGTVVGSGTVNSYVGTSLIINVTSAIPGYNVIASNGPWVITPISIGFINTFVTAAGGVYPSNSDVWWYFKDNTGAFAPSTTLANTSYTTGLAPRGHFILPAFSQDRGSFSGTPITPVVTNARPTTGAWFQGRVWYAGVNDNSPAQGDANSYTWTENIYFSQIVNTVSDFGSCYQVNDPTSETLNGLLPTDGGVIKIVGTGRIHKLFVISNGLLVFANNGVWFITGSQGIGFTANDYTVTKISSIKCLSPYSFIDVNGLPFFWNEEGIYQVVPTQSSGLSVEPITVGTILTFYNDIPVASKYYARGDYNPIDYVIQWTYRSTQESSVNNRYYFDKILNYNVYNKAFYPYTVAQGTQSQSVHGVNYISYPNITNQTPEAGFIYPSSRINLNIQFAKEQDTTFKDWDEANYDSYFVTGYKIHGQAQKKFQVPYIYVYSRNNEVNGYYIQGIWDYAINGNSGRWSTKQYTLNNNPNFGSVFRRHRFRGNGYVMQIKVTSQDNLPFDIMGWSVYENLNQGV